MNIPGETHNVIQIKTCFFEHQGKQRQHLLFQNDPFPDNQKSNENFRKKSFACKNYITPA